MRKPCIPSLVVLLVFSASTILNGNAPDLTKPEWPAWYNAYILSRESKIDVIDIHSLSLADSIDVVKQKFSENNNVGMSAYIKQTPVAEGVDPSARINYNNIKRTINLKTTSALDAFKQVSKLYGCRIEFTDVCLLVLPYSNKPKQITMMQFDVAGPVPEFFDRLPPEIVDVGPELQIAYLPAKRVLLCQVNAKDASCVAQVLKMFGIKEQDNMSSFKDAPLPNTGK